MAIQIGADRPVMLLIGGTNEPARGLHPPTLLFHDSGDPLGVHAIAGRLQGVRREP